MYIRTILRYGLIFLALLFVYDIIGVVLAYVRHPRVSKKTKQETDVSSFYNGASTGCEYASIIGENSEALLQRVRLIEAAQEEIIMSTFSFHSDESGKIIIGALLAAAERGVDVKVIVDGLDGRSEMHKNPYFYAFYSYKNIEVKLYNSPNLLKPWKLMGRLHDKYLIADKKVYILGGRNTYNYFLGDYPGQKNHDRDVLVYCEDINSESSVSHLVSYFNSVWSYCASRDFIEKIKRSNRSQVEKACKEVNECYKNYLKENKDKINDRDFKKDMLKTEKITLLSNPIHTSAKEPAVWYKLTAIMKSAKQYVCVHTPYIIFNRVMHKTWGDTAAAVPKFSLMTNSAANNANLFGAAEYAANKKKILKTGTEIWEYEGGSSYHGKSILIDDDISVVGSFNMDMRSAYLDTELMLVICSKDINNSWRLI